MNKYVNDESAERKRFLQWLENRHAYSTTALVDAAYEGWLAAHADLLEAREKAVPVGEVVGVAGSYGEMRMISWRDRYSPAVGTKLYTHSVPSDADRLAEALRIIRNDANDTGQKFGSPAECIEAIARTVEAALAAHYAQAQPPAASVPDDFARKVCDEYFHQLYLAGIESPSILHTARLRAALKAALAAQENPNG